MKIAFFTEMGFVGKVPRNHPNMRTECAWMCALEADHISLNNIVGAAMPYDLGIVIIPKKNPNVDLTQVRNMCKKVAVMQEGPHWYWQDYDLAKQIHYINTLSSADYIFAHNSIDRDYYRGLLNRDKDVFVMPTLMIEDSIDKGLFHKSKRKGVMLGGNMVSWYGGFDSYMIAQEFNEEITAPSMGRKIAQEEELDIQHLPYYDWTQWMAELNDYKYGVHLMRTHAAGTFALNCAYLGIPCIGYVGLDTQEQCNPWTSVELGDLDAARAVAKHLASDKDFYNDCSAIAKERYNKNWTEKNFRNKFFANLS